MDKEKICKSIRDQLEDIREQFEIIRSYEGKIPSIELDLILSNIRDLYENLLQLEKINQPVLSFSVDERKASPEAPSVEPEPIVIRVKKTEKPTPPEPEIQKPEPDTPARTNEVVQSDERNPEPPVIRIKPVAEPRSETPPVTETRPVKTTLDLFGESSATLADRLKETPEKRVADKLQANKVSDLRNAIGINEKFLYINELFDGSLRDYEEAVTKLNACTDPDEASMIIFELRERYRWDLDNPAVRSFIELVNRKF